MGHMGTAGNTFLRRDDSVDFSGSVTLYVTPLSIFLCMVSVHLAAFWIFLEDRDTLDTSAICIYTDFLYSLSSHS